MTRPVAVVGEALIDLLPGTDASGLVAHPGGSNANVAVAAARLGAPTRFLGRLSSDRWGQLLRAHLAAAGVDVSSAPEGGEPTALAVVDVGADGQPRYRFLWEGTADRMLELAELPDDLGDTAVLHVGSVSCVLEPGRQAIRDLVDRERDDRIVTFDPNIRSDLVGAPDQARSHLLDLARSAHVVKASDEDLEWLAPGTAAEDFAHDLAARDVALVAITRGARGAELVGQRAQVTIPAVEGPVVDTVGAGDTFMAGLIVGLLEAGLDTPHKVRTAGPDALIQAGKLAARAASVTVSRAGANPPTRDEIA